MNDLDMISRARPQLGPSPATRERHRRELSVALSHAGTRHDAAEPAAQPLGYSPTSGARHARSRRRAMVLGGAAIVAAIVAGALAVSGTDDSAPKQIHSPVADSTPPSTAAAVTPICGDLPGEPNLPPEYVGPISGPSPASSIPADGGQLVEHWQSPTGSVEVRWPSAAMPEQPPDPEPADGSITLNSASLAAAHQDESTGLYTQQAYLRFTAPLACQWLLVTFADTNLETLNTTQTSMMREPFRNDAPIVRATTDAAEAPEVAGCQTPPGVTSPNTGGDVAAPTPYPEPSAALSAFLDAHPTLLPRGYIEFHLPDGTIAYGIEAPTQEFFVTVIHVRHDAAGWIVDNWTASGC